MSYNISYVSSGSTLSSTNVSGSISDMNSLGATKYGDIFIETSMADLSLPTCGKTCYVQCSCNTSKGWYASKPSGNYVTATSTRTYAYNNSKQTCYKAKGCPAGYYSSVPNSTYFNYTTSGGCYKATGCKSPYSTSGSTLVATYSPQNYKCYESIQYYNMKISYRVCSGTGKIQMKCETGLTLGLWVSYYGTDSRFLESMTYFSCDKAYSGWATAATAGTTQDNAALSYAGNALINGGIVVDGRGICGASGYLVNFNGSGTYTCSGTYDSEIEKWTVQLVNDGVANCN